MRIGCSRPPICPCANVAELTGKSCRPGLKKCRDCRKQFTVTTGTIFHRTHVALWQWVYAFARMCASKKGVSAHQLHRELGVTYKTGWFICHRIRHAMGPDAKEVKLTGTVEVDETYVGGKPRKKGVSKRGRGTKKTPVVALVERNGRVRSRAICNVTANTLKSAIRNNVDPSATIMTDEHTGYRGIGTEFAGGHRTVNHGRGEYAKRDGTSTNTIESHFALIKRGMYGVFHHVSRGHLQRYCHEFDFRWNHRKTSDTERTLAALRGAEGKRLMYREPAA